eukprot:3716884-Rhodomonas_salina.1
MIAASHGGFQVFKTIIRGMIMMMPVYSRAFPSQSSPGHLHGHGTSLILGSNGGQPEALPHCSHRDRGLVLLGQY